VLNQSQHISEDVLCESVDRIIVMNEGAIISDTTPDELLRQDTLGWTDHCVILGKTVSPDTSANLSK
jgi:ABC-type multidrug transport system ATPase subunit